MRNRVLAVLSLLLLVFAGVACSNPQKPTGFPTIIETSEDAHGGEDEEESPSPTATGGGPVDLQGPVEVIDSAFEPREATVTAGTTVTWRQTGSAPHSVTSVEEGQFDSHPECLSGQKCMGAGDTFEHTFDEPGRYEYYCVIHASPTTINTPSAMAGVIIVE